MKVAIVGPVYPYRGGIAHYTTLLAQAFARQHETRVFSFRSQYPSWLYPGQSDRDPSQEPLRVAAEYTLSPLAPWTWLQAERQIARWQPDLVVAAWWTTFWAPALGMLAFGLRRRGIPLVFLIHNVLPHETRPWDAPLARFALGQGRYFLVQTGREQERLAALLPGRQAVVAPHPVYDMFAGQRLPKAEARRKLGLPEERPVVLFFGIVRPYKGLGCLVEAIARLKEQGQPLTLLAAGEFWEDPAVYQEQIERLGLAGQVRLENRYIPNEEVGVFFSAADVFAAPYLHGTTSGAVKLALGFDLPVALTRDIADPALLERPGRVSIVPPNDPAALAQAIAGLLQAAAGAGPGSAAAQGESWEDLVNRITRLGAWKVFQAPGAP
ncbi:MAG TPA: glycosyltransferase [Anaerolineales bacterium]